MKEEKGQIIEFPLNIKPNPAIKVDSYALQMQQDMTFADHLTEGLIVNMIHNMSENGVDTEEESFIADISLMIELVKSTLYRSCDIPHPMQTVVDEFVETTKENNKTSVFLDCFAIRDAIVGEEVEEDDEE